MRFDIGWLDFALALTYCAMPRKRESVILNTKRAWNSQDDFLITLSVRSAFDLLLRALQLPHGSEVLLTALTVPDMVRIVEMHGLVPVPLDIDEGGNVDAELLKRAISPQTRMVVIAHLFGGLVPMNEVLEIAHEQGLMVVEDCAQGFCRVGDSATSSSDVAMFSFGPIKTASALGGAVVRVKSQELRQRMESVLTYDPIQSQLSFLSRLTRFAALKLLSGKRTACMTKYCMEKAGFNFDSLANSIVRGFSSSQLLAQLRRQPSVPLLKLLARRWRTYDLARIEERITMGRHMDKRIGREHGPSHSYWVYPVFVHDPIAVRDRLREAGFDATCQARMSVVPASDDTRQSIRTSNRWKQVVFLPWYPGMPIEEVDKMASLIQSTLGSPA
jgi:dTDP-4-amino-4,6-dideoxygalactose transaminase